MDTQAVGSFTNLGRRHDVLGLCPLRHLGGGVVVVRTAVSSAVLLPDSSPRQGNLSVDAVHREYRVSCRVAFTTAQVYRGRQSEG